jgi:hypothetical protein
MPDDRIADVLDLEEFDYLLDFLARPYFFRSRAAEKEGGFQNARFQMNVATDEDVLDDRAMFEKREILKGPRDSTRHETRLPLMRDIDAVEYDPPARRAQDAADEVEERCLSGAVGAYDAADLAARHIEAHVGDGAQSAECPRQGLDLQQRRAQDNHLLRLL